MMPNPATVEILLAIICPSAVVRLPSLRVCNQNNENRRKLVFKITLSFRLSQWKTTAVESLSIDSNQFALHNEKVIFCRLGESNSRLQFHSRAGK